MFLIVLICPDHGCVLAEFASTSTENELFWWPAVGFSNFEEIQDPIPPRDQGDVNQRASHESSEVPRFVGTMMPERLLGTQQQSGDWPKRRI